jgi:dihydropteroate synthase
VAEETRRVVPFVETVRERHPELLISVDTWRHEVAGPALAAGADILNDTWGGVDPKLAEIAAACGCGVVCSHTGGARPRTRPHRVHYCDVVRDVADDLVAQAEKLLTLGVPKEAILIDPTHDFGKNTWHGLELLRRLGELVATGWPVLMALSNKDFIGETLGVGVADRVEGTLAATAIAAWAGVRVFRAHQVRETRRVLEMVASIAGTRPPSRAVRGLA